MYIYNNCFIINVDSEIVVSVLLNEYDGCVTLQDLNFVTDIVFIFGQISIDFVAWNVFNAGESSPQQLIFCHLFLSVVNK